MKFLSTRICVNPKVSNKIILSYDFEIWKSNYDIDKIKLYYHDQYGLDITDENVEDFQPKNSEALNFAEADFLPCILSVENKDYNDWCRTGIFCPNSEIYENAKLVFLGYDIMDLCYISIKSHGISAEYEKNYDSLNLFGLFGEYEYAINYLEKNIKYIPEHEWKIVGIYTNKIAFDILRKLVC